MEIGGRERWEKMDFQIFYFLQGNIYTYNLNYTEMSVWLRFYDISRFLRKKKCVNEWVWENPSSMDLYGAYAFLLQNLRLSYPNRKDPEEYQPSVADLKNKTKNKSKTKPNANIPRTFLHHIDLQILRVTWFCEFTWDSPICLNPSFRKMHFFTPSILRI